MRSLLEKLDLLRYMPMVVTNSTCKVKRTPKKKTAVRLRIAQDKARSRRWAEQRKERNARAIISNEDCTMMTVAVSIHEP